jgi:hypothetical protein
VLRRDRGGQICSAHTIADHPRSTADPVATGSTRRPPAIPQVPIRRIGLAVVALTLTFAPLKCCVGGAGVRLDSARGRRRGSTAREVVVVVIVPRRSRTCDPRIRSVSWVVSLNVPQRHDAHNGRSSARGSCHQPLRRARRRLRRSGTESGTDQFRSPGSPLAGTPGAWPGGFACACSPAAIRIAKRGPVPGFLRIGPIRALGRIQGRVRLFYSKTRSGGARRQDRFGSYRPSGYIGWVDRIQSRTLFLSHGLVLIAA